MFYTVRLFSTTAVPSKLTSVVADKYLRDSGLFPSTLSLESPRGQDYRNTVSIVQGSRSQNIKSIFSHLGVSHISVWQALHFRMRSQNCETRLLASSCLYVRLCARSYSAPTGRIFIKFDI